MDSWRNFISYVLDVTIFLLSEKKPIKFVYKVGILTSDALSLFYSFEVVNKIADTTSKYHYRHIVLQSTKRDNNTDSVTRCNIN